MLRLMKERTDLNVVSDQLGSPTYAKDLAEGILQIIQHIQSTNKIESGIYHFSNGGIISWYEFATAIQNNAALQCNIHAITTAQYPTPAKRPVYSVMSKDKIRSVYGIQIKEWEISLQECLQKLL
jgi:dTDP-4-dehydrorhamnose reductase